jgi:hypothetical protein
VTRSLLIGLLTVQVLTFVAYGALMLARGNWRIGVGQLLLAAVQAIVYSAGLPR